MFAPESELMARLDQFGSRWRESQRTARATEIVVVAAKVLADEGLARFSMRRVAERSAMSLASLQYHFSSLADLLRAMIDYRLYQYAERAKSYLRGLSANPLQAFNVHVAEFIDDAMSAHTARFTLQYQALACIDEYASTALDEYMKMYRESLALFIQRLNPSVSENEALARGATVAGMIDGLMIIAAEGRPIHLELREMKRTVGNSALLVASAPALFNTGSDS